MEISDNINLETQNNLNINQNLDIQAQHNEKKISTKNSINNLDFINKTQIELNNKYCESLELPDLYLYLKKIINDNNNIQQTILIIKVIKKIIRNKLQEYKKEKQKINNQEKIVKNKNSIHFWEEKFKEIFDNFNKKHQVFYEERKKQFEKNLEKRKKIIEELKQLYTNPHKTNNQIFKKFREIKSKWHHAGIVSKNIADSLFKTYFHHLDNFYAYLNLNKDLQSMDYAHNLQQRKVIINRAKELLNQENLFKSLNELQYLHKLWKEEAEPVEEQYKESTWIEFKIITNKIHEKKNNWIIENQKKEIKNLKLKKEIINQLNDLVYNKHSYSSHNNLQKTIKHIDLLREKFIKIGKTPKEDNNIIWKKFKEILKSFSRKKNDFYKSQKNEQNKNLVKKNELIDIANTNKNSENWIYSLELFKKIQNEWKTIGHIPKKISNKKWNEFKNACDYFFNRYKNQHQENYHEFKKNLDLKYSILDKLNLIKNDTKKEEENIIQNIKQLNNQWNQIGRIPKEKIDINLSFYKICKEIFNQMNMDKKQIDKIQIELQFQNIILSKDQKKLIEELKKIKKQIQELKNNITILENNLSFFRNTNKKNPLIQNVYKKLENKKNYLQELSKNFNILSRLNLSKT